MIIEITIHDLIVCISVYKRSDLIIPMVIKFLKLARSTINDVSKNT